MPAIVRPVGDERDGLLTFLDHERHVLLIAAYGLTDEQAQLRPTVSDLSIQSLLEHMASTERTWASMVQGVTRPPDDERSKTLGTVIADYRDAIAATDAVGAARHSLVGALGPAPPHPRDCAPRGTRRPHS